MRANPSFVLVSVLVSVLTTLFSQVAASPKAAPIVAAPRLGFLAELTAGPSLGIDRPLKGCSGGVLLGMAGEHLLVLAGGGGANEVGLPGDVKTPSWTLYIPAVADVTLQTSDIVTDDLERRYIVTAAELSPLGWRLLLQQAVT